MAVLSLRLLGPFTATLNDHPINNFKTNKVQALLIFLATEKERAHQRESLMEFLWPGMPRESAQVNLRQTLYRLRQAIPEVTSINGGKTVPLIQSNRQVIGIHPQADVRVDVLDFQDALANNDPTQAAKLYRGAFLADFYLVDSSVFEDWATGLRESLRRAALRALDDLTERKLEDGEFAKAQDYAWGQLEIDPLHEGAYRQLMTALANAGQRNAAISLYQLCRGRLDKELGLEPSPETTRLYEQIQADTLRQTRKPESTPRPAPESMPVFLLTDIEGSTRLWDTHRQAMLPALLKHNQILENCITRHNGRILELRGDGVKAVFESANPLQCMLDIQKSLAETDWGQIGDLRIRIGLHGVPPVRKGFDYFEEDDRYYGPVLNHTARIMDAGHGGQTLVSELVHQKFSLPVGARWQDFGEHQVKSLDHPLQIYGLLHPDLPLQSFPALRTGSAAEEPEQPESPTLPEQKPVTEPEKAIHHNLPSQPTPFIGRVDELAQLDEILNDPAIRLVTIVGPGGMGKTRLALATAEQVLETAKFPDGVIFVDLALLDQADQIHLAVVEALQIQLSAGEAGTSRQQLLNFLVDKGMLFILDNFEHLLAGAQLVSEMLQTAPGVKVLVTSRERLHLRLEHLFPISGLKFPDWEAPQDAAEYTGPQLFLNAACRIRPDFELAEDDPAHLTRICRLVDGMPLALELAAGWVEMLPLAEIATEIQQGLDFLETDLQDIPDRHRSMQAIFESTWERLEPLERQVMEQLSVFRGGFSRDAVQQIIASQESISVNLRLLARLVSKSLLRVDPTRARYQIHELLRQYAWERLEHSGKLDDTRSAHASYFFKLLYQREADIKGGRDQKGALDEIEADFANIQVAWKWALAQGDLEVVDRSLEALTWFCRIRNRALEGVYLLLLAEDLFTPGPDRISNRIWRRIAARRISLKIWTWEGYLESDQNEIEELINIARQRGQLDELAFALEVYGRLAYRINISTARQMQEESVSIFHSLGDTFSAYQTMGPISWSYTETGQPGKRMEIIKQQLEMAQKCGDRLTAADAQGVLGFIAERAGQYLQAEKTYLEVLPVFREYGDRWHTCEYLIRLGELAFLKGDFCQSRQNIAEGQTLGRQYNIEFASSFNHSTLSMLHNAAEQYNQALRICQEIITLLGPREAFPILRGKVYALCGSEDFAAARENLEKALEMAVAIQADGWQVQSLPAAALIAASDNQLERAAELLALAYHHPAAATGWLERFPLVTRLKARLESELSPKRMTAAWNRGKGLDLTEIIDTLRLELSTSE